MLDRRAQASSIDVVQPWTLLLLKKLCAFHAMAWHYCWTERRVLHQPGGPHVLGRGLRIPVGSGADRTPPSRPLPPEPPQQPPSSQEARAVPSSSVVGGAQSLRAAPRSAQRLWEAGVRFRPSTGFLARRRRVRRRQAEAGDARGGAGRVHLN